MKVIRPLFLDELRAEFEKIKSSKAKLREFHNKLASLTFFDPACGCGNFLVLAYRELRLLEIEVLEILYKGSQKFLGTEFISQVDVDQFYGIEIVEFPVRIAETALWLMDRDQQFKLIKRATTRFKNAGWPVISVDAKNKEKIGDFKNDGAKWEAEGKREEVDAHDFGTKTTLKATPFGVYDVVRNEGLVEVGTSLNTARFAVDSIRRWWKIVGKKKYPHAKRLLILADSGGSNGCRIWMWKKLLCELANETGLIISVRHYPRGASKWNPVEHRLFGPIAKNWAGHPLRSMEILLGFIRGTATQTGLRVKARWNRRRYPPKEKVSKEEKTLMNFKRHDVIPLWNYTVYPDCK